MKKPTILLVLMLAGVLGLQAQTGKDKLELKLSLRDGSIFTGQATISSIQLTTSYGKLDIPIKNVSSIEFGITADYSAKSKIQLLLKDISSSEEQRRKTAYDDLLQLDIRALPVLNELIGSPGYTASTYTDYTAEMALEDLKNRYNVDDPSNVQDVIIFDDMYRIGGSGDIKSITLKTDYGVLDIAKEKIKNADVYYSSGSDAELTYTLLGNKHIYSNQNGGWLRTSISLRAGQRFSITATGEITFASLSGYKYKPDGTYDGSTTANYDDYGYTNTAASTYPTYGNVIFKIGESGTMMKAGAKYTGTAITSGALYISVYESVFNTANTGSYTVKIKVN